MRLRVALPAALLTPSLLAVAAPTRGSAGAVGRVFVITLENEGATKTGLAPLTSC